MARRIGGLVISRMVGDAIQLLYPNGNEILVEVKNLIKDGAVIQVGSDCYDMLVGDSVTIPGVQSISSSGIYLESTEGGRVAIRLIADPRIRILRTELLR